MDVLNFISWLKSKRQVTTVDASQTLIPLGLKDARRGDAYLPGAISVEDLLALSPGLPSFVEYNETNKTLWNNGITNNSANTSFGEGALTGSPDSYVTAIGHNAVRIGTGGDNTGIGAYALGNLVAASRNTAVGSFALAGDLTGSNNVAIGATVLATTTSGFCNVGIGYQALIFNTTGSRNVSIGEISNYANTTGVNNTSLGAYSNLSNTVGSFNVAIGYNSLSGNTSGNYNACLGSLTSSNNFSGSVILGSNAIATGNNQFVVGSNSYNAGAIATEALVPTKSWTVKINGVDYKIPLQVA